MFDLLLVRRSTSMKNFNLFLLLTKKFAFHSQGPHCFDYKGTIVYALKREKRNTWNYHKGPKYFSQPYSKYKVVSIALRNKISSSLLYFLGS